VALRSRASTRIHARGTLKASLSRAQAVSEARMVRVSGRLVPLPDTDTTGASVELANGATTPITTTVSATGEFSLSVSQGLSTLATRLAGYRSAVISNSRKTLEEILNEVANPTPVVAAPVAPFAATAAVPTELPPPTSSLSRDKGFKAENRARDPSSSPEFGRLPLRATPRFFPASRNS
jgi:hypothetical protein